MRVQAAFPLMEHVKQASADPHSRLLCLQNAFGVGLIQMHLFEYTLSC